MSELNANDGFCPQDDRFDSFSEPLELDQDLLAEHILENIKTTPIGQLLEKIVSLPEIRTEKVLKMRQLLKKGQYDINEHLDVAIDKVLEELIT